jgi:DNA-binding response OmpR family regulator
MPNVLIVQDDFLVAEQLRRTLEGAGRRVTGVVGRTLPALESASREPPDLTIVDMMPEIDVDGLHTASELARRAGVKVLITTGFPDQVLERYGTDELACAVVRKPYTDEEILDAVRRCVG